MMSSPPHTDIQSRVSKMRMRLGQDKLLPRWSLRHIGVSKMTDRTLQAYRELQRFVLPKVQTTGIILGEGSYGIVEELKVEGLVCAGKRLHKALVEQGNAGVEKIVSRFLESCRVTRQIILT